MAVAAPLELAAILRGLDCPGKPAHEWELVEALPGVDIVLTGVGKANAAGAIGRLADPLRHRVVLNIGVGGLLPGSSGLEPGAAVLATRSVFADEGVQEPGRFVDCAALGFPAIGGAMGIAASPGPAGRVRSCVDAESVVACVSTCSGTDELAREVARRTGAAVEAMEGAAAGLSARRIGLEFLEVRVISNSTGDRPRQRWELAMALDRTSRLIGPILRTLRDA